MPVSSNLSVNTAVDSNNLSLKNDTFSSLASTDTLASPASFEQPIKVTSMPVLQRPTVVVVNVQQQDPTLPIKITSLEAERTRLLEESAKLNGEKFSVLSTLATREDQLEQSKKEATQSQTALMLHTEALQDQTLHAKTLELENEALRKRLEEVYEENQNNKQQKSITDQRYATLLEHCESTHKELSSLRDDLAIRTSLHNKSVQEQEVRYQTLFTQNTQLLSTITDVTQKKDNLQKHIQTVLTRIKTAFTQKVEEMQHLTEELSRTRKEAETNKTQIEEQQATLSTIQKNLARVGAEKEALSQQLQQKMNEVHAIKNQAQRFLQEQQQQMTTFVQGKMQAAVQQAQGVAQKAEESRKTLEHNANREVARRMEQIAALQLQLENETAQKAQAEEKAQALQLKLAHATSTSPSQSSRPLAQENAQLKHNVEELTGQLKNQALTHALTISLNNTQHQQIQTQQQQLQKQENVLRQLQAHEREGTTERTQLQERLNQALKRVESAEQASKAAQQERITQAQQIETLRRQVAAQAEASQKKEEQNGAEKNKLLTRVTTLEAQMTQALNEKCVVQKVLKDIELTMTQERRTKEAQTGALSAKNTSLERELSAAEETLRHQKQQIEQGRIQMQRVITQVRREREEYIENLQKRLATAEINVNVLEARLQART